MVMYLSTDQSLFVLVPIRIMFHNDRDVLAAYTI